MDRFTEEMTRSSRRERDEDTGCTELEMAVPAGMIRRYAIVPSGSVNWLEALPAAECVQCGSEKRTVQGDREIRQGAVCCTEVA